MNYLLLTLFASVYGDGNYGDCEYSEGCVDAGTGTGGSTGGLADTGFWIALIATLACLIIFIALLARWLANRSSKKQASAAPALKSKKTIRKK